jgi:hypothetical protein
MLPVKRERLAMIIKIRPIGKSIALINAAHSGDGAGPPAITAVAAASERTAPAPIEFKKVIKGFGS